MKYVDFIKTFNPKVKSEIVRRIYYYGLLFGIFLFTGFILLIMSTAKEEKRRYPYRTDPKFKKVIKEGIIFDTTEYHEK